MGKYIYLAYANQAEKPLPALKREETATQRVLQSKDKQGYSIITRSFASTQDLITDIKNYRDDLCIFHYSGHAEGDRLLLQDQDGDAQALAAMLKGCQNLKLIFLNGCTTQPQVEFMLDNSNKRAVIATTTVIPDEIAADFAIWFYEQLSIKGISVEQAFEYAESVIQFRYNVGRATENRGIGNTKSKNAAYEWQLLGEQAAKDWSLEYFNPIDQEKQMGLKEFLKRLCFAYEPVVSVLLKIHEGQFPPGLKQIELIVDEWIGFQKAARAVKAGEEFNSGTLIEKISNILPTPVGIQMERFFRKAREYADNPKRKHLRLATQVYDACMQLLAFTMLSQMWEAVRYTNILPSQTSKLDNIKRFFTGSKEETKIFNLVLLIKSSREVFESIADKEGKEKRVREECNQKLERIKKEISLDSDLWGVISFFQDLNETKSQLVKEKFVTELSALKTEIEEKGELHEIVNFFQSLKERLANNEVRDDQIAALYIDSEYLLCAFLRRICFILRYSLITIKSIVLRKYRHDERPGYDHSMAPLIIQKRFDYGNYTYQDFSYTKSVVLVKDLNRMGNNLPLSPFYIDKNVFFDRNQKKTPNISDLHAYCGYDHEEDVFYFRRVEDPDDIFKLDKSDNCKEFKVIREQLEAFSQKVFALPFKELHNESPESI